MQRRACHRTRGNRILKGINLSGFSDRGAFYHPNGTSEHTVNRTMVDLYVSKKMNFFRLPIYWERLQPTVNGAFDATVWSNVQECVNYCLSKGATVMLNNHCFAGRDVSGVARKLGSAELAYSALSDFWTRIAAVYGTNQSVWLDLINEPESLPNNGYATQTDALVALYNTVIAALRTAGTTTRVVIEGNGHNNAQDFDSNPYYNTGTVPPTSAAAFHAGIVDSANNWVASCHNYPDTPHGSGANAVDATILRTRFQEVIDWAIATKRQVICGEWSVIATDPNGIGVTQDYLSMLEANKSRILAWSWWSGRSKDWGSSVYTIAGDAVADDARWAWLQSNLDL